MSSSAPAPDPPVSSAPYLVAVATVGGASLVHWLLTPWVGHDVPFTVFLLAVAASAFVGGAGPGLMATLLSVVMAHLLAGRSGALTGPVGGAGYAIRVSLFGLVGMVLSLFSELRQRAARRAESAGTDALQKAAALRDSESRFEQMVETANEGIWQIDAQARTIYANRHMSDLLGYTPEEMSGLDAFALVPEEAREASRAVWAQEAREKSRKQDFVYRRKDGSDVWLHCSSSPILDSEGQFRGAIGMFTDVTARRAGEESLRRSESLKETQLAVGRLLADAAGGEDVLRQVLERVQAGLDFDMSALWVIDRRQANTLRCLEVADAPREAGAAFEAATRQAAFGPGAGLPGRVWTSGEPAWVPDIGADPDFPRQEAALAAGFVSALGFPLNLGGQTLGVVELFAGARHEEDSSLGPTLAVLGSQIAHFLEGSRAAEAREALLRREQDARREAEAASRMKDEFLATLSHELRTPLNAVVGWAHLLRTGQLKGDKAQKAMEVIDRNARAQSQVVADLLDVSRITMGKLRLDVSTVMVAPLIQAALESIGPSARAKEIRIAAALDSAVGPVSADPDRLQQVLWNLLHNAVKFTPPRGEVRVGLSGGDNGVEIVVEDTGEGISADFLPHIFERFRQRDSSPTRAHGGLGLGLALVRDLVEIHGGTVAASSPGENQGTRFVVRLPRVVQAEAETAGARSAG